MALANEDFMPSVPGPPHEASILVLPTNVLGVGLECRIQEGMELNNVIPICRDLVPTLVQLAYCRLNQLPESIVSGMHRYRVVAAFSGWGALVQWGSLQHSATQTKEEEM